MSKERTEVRYPYLPSTNLSELVEDMIKTCDENNYVLDESIYNNSVVLGMLMLNTPVFSGTIINEVLNCPVSTKKIHLYLYRMQKRGQIKSVSVSSDSSIRVIYYLTKQGYNDFCSFLPGCHGYMSKNGKRLATTALHDLGVSYIYFSFIRSPFQVFAEYESSKTFDKAAMPNGKHMKRSIRPDVILNYKSSRSFGVIYGEHDTGSESAFRMIDKLNQYLSHDILYAGHNGRIVERDPYECNMVLYTFRSCCPSQPDCFSKSAVKNLLSYMEDGRTVDMLSADELSPSARSALLSLPNWTYAFKNHWGYEEMVAYLKGLEEQTHPSFIRYLKFTQREGAATRRNQALKLLMGEYKKGESSDFYSVIREMLLGFPVGFSAVNNLDRYLSLMYMEDYPDTVAWIMDVMTPYYGNTTYHARRMLFKNPHPEKPHLSMSNLFQTESGELVSVEYLSCDLSALMRIYAIYNFAIDFKQAPFKVILIVDSVKDAVSLINLMEPRFRTGTRTLNHANFFDLTYLNVGGNFLYTIKDDNTIVRVNKTIEQIR